MDKKVIKKILSPFYKIRYRLIHTNGWLYIGSHCKIVNPKNIMIGKGVQVAPYSLICAHGTGTINLEDNVNVGMFSRVACINNITIKKNVLTGPHIFISDYNHEYKNVELPICEQGTTPANCRVVIDEGAWIGTNTVICGNVRIGKNSVVGAGAFVNCDIPSYSVAIGNPARVIKQYDFDKKEWIRVKNECQ